MKKILFAAYSLDIGGIEKALLTLANYLQKRNYSVTIILEKKQGIFLKQLDPNIHVIEYRPNESKNRLKRKIINAIKRIQFIFQYKNKYDFSAAFATYSKVASFVSTVASKNNCLWGHADYLTLFNYQKEEVKKFFEEKKYDRFKHIVFVSEEGKKSFLEIFPKMKERTITCNNLVDGKKILEMANEAIDMPKDEEKFTFINIGRHDEKQKRLTRIIGAAEKLKKENNNFKVLFIGDGQDNQLYKEMVREKQLENTILFLGKKKNPYPYFKIADCVVLSSDYEGYPVVFLESFILNKPIITTKVSDYKEIELGRGLVAEKNEQDIYEKMKNMLEKGYNIEKEFDIEQYNQEIIEKLEKLF